LVPRPPQRLVPARRGRTSAAATAARADSPNPLAAANGEGFIAVASVTVEECVNRFDLVEVAAVPACSDAFYLITGERRISHPALRLIAENARALTFA
jgi:hypothetical protein